MKTIKKILVPTDLSDLSFEAIELAKSLAKVYKARLFLLHTVDVVPVVSFPTVDFTLETALNDETEKAKDIVERIISEKLSDVDDVAALIRRGVAYEEIMKFVNEEGIDLIVMATHGRTGLPHIIMGSVAEKIVRHSHVPVMTVKPPKVRRSLKTADEQELQPHERKSRIFI
ncbi:MAG: universal stress protein [Ignavibacteriales bacterium]|nr:universal stress protein [Ignavibacteriales bacterium]